VIIVCGESIVDLVPDPLAPLKYGAKPGGGPANTAVAIARLGSPVSMLARLSRDGFGRLLRAHLVDNGVDASHAVDAAEPSSVAVAVLADDGSADYRFLVAGTADWGWTDAELNTVLSDPAPSDAVALHSGSLALALAPGGAALERLLTRARPPWTVSLDPNIRAALIADLGAHRQVVERCVAAADIVKVSAEDLAELYPNERADDVARRWARSGPAVVVRTDGPTGASAFLADEEVTCNAEPVTVVDTIGAGDAFGGALLDWLSRAGKLGGRLALSAADIAAAMRHANRVAAITCSRAGADPPYLAELEVTAAS
jgi:fructokinase